MITLFAYWFFMIYSPQQEALEKAEKAAKLAAANQPKRMYGNAYGK